MGKSQQRDRSKKPQYLSQHRRLLVLVQEQQKCLRDYNRISGLTEELTAEERGEMRRVLKKRMGLQHQEISELAETLGFDPDQFVTMVGMETFIDQQTEG